MQSAPAAYGQGNGSSLSTLLRTHKSVVNPPMNLKIESVIVSPAQLLVTVGDTLYMLNQKRQIIWRWDVGRGEDILDQPIINAHGYIYGIALDGIIFSLDSNGKERWRGRLNGPANYSRIKSYGKDQYLVLIDNSAYREIKGHDEEDILILSKDREILARKFFPRNAELRVRGNRVFAVMKNRHGFKLKEIRM